jgi:hypothetical protein
MNKGTWGGRKRKTGKKGKGEGENDKNTTGRKDGKR